MQNQDIPMDPLETPTSSMVIVPSTSLKFILITPASFMSPNIPISLTFSAPLMPHAHGPTPGMALSPNLEERHHRNIARNEELTKSLRLTELGKEFKAPQHQPKPQPQKKQALENSEESVACNTQARSSSTPDSTSVPATPSPPSPHSCYLEPHAIPPESISLQSEPTALQSKCAALQSKLAALESKLAAPGSKLAAPESNWDLPQPEPEGTALQLKPKGVSPQPEYESEGVALQPESKHAAQQPGAALQLEYKHTAPQPKSSTALTPKSKHSALQPKSECTAPQPKSQGTALTLYCPAAQI
jgi:hypothetical protein